ncbi:glycerol-3-phosphate 1-O-acyltransferase PlsY [Anaplasma platys]|uniref:glycerol-3-phosphate 1-O-acyltransferase PlsY n=1 Tax=Anaplasma platys TaxID=949 RepID=UPI00145EF0B0|nr:glycerol-3-phosphate 1-O-acyltransferase PlsY [Anaplasma platys]
MFLSIALLSYLIGSIPFAWIIPKLVRKEDIRETGSKNVGATNVFRRSKVMGLLVLSTDLAKGAIPIACGKIMGTDPVCAYLCGLFVVIGHIFPLWLKFKGGKGVAANLGALTLLNPAAAVSFFISWSSTFAISKISSLSTLVALATSIFVCAMTEENKISVFVYVITSILITYKHKENIELLLKDEEKRLF